jgi:hypothetical protein
MIVQQRSTEIQHTKEGFSFRKKIGRIHL